MTKMSTLIGRLHEGAGAGGPSLDEIDIKPLEQKVAQLLKAPVKLTAKLSAAGPWRLIVGSDELVGKAGIFAAVMSAVVVKGAGHYSAEHNMMQIPLDLAWENTAGGSNGLTLLRAWYDFGKKAWTFKGAA
jgi:hypothetical protein